MEERLLEPSIVEKLKERYEVHPLIFHRAAERANSPGELFDILETIPNDFPIIWDDDERKFVYTTDLTLASRFNLLGEDTC